LYAQWSGLITIIIVRIGPEYCAYNPLHCQLYVYSRNIMACGRPSVFPSTVDGGASPFTCKTSPFSMTAISLANALIRISPRMECSPCVGSGITWLNISNSTLYVSCFSQFISLPITNYSSVQRMMHSPFPSSIISAIIYARRCVGVGTSRPKNWFGRELTHSIGSISALITFISIISRISYGTPSWSEQEP